MTTLKLTIVNEPPARVRGIINQELDAVEIVGYASDDERLGAFAESLKDKLPAAFEVVRGARRVDVRRVDRRGKATPMVRLDRDETEAEREQARAEIRALTRKELESMVTRGAEAVAKVVAASTTPGEFTRQVSWGHAIEEDLLAAYAAEALATLDDPKFLKPIEDVLRHYLGELTRRALRVADRPTSTNPFSNAVAIERMDVDRKFREFCERHLEWIERRT